MLQDVSTWVLGPSPIFEKVKASTVASHCAAAIQVKIGTANWTRMWSLIKHLHLRFGAGALTILWFRCVLSCVMFIYHVCIIGLVKVNGNIYRKPWLLPSKMDVSCKFSHQPTLGLYAYGILWLWHYRFYQSVPAETRCDRLSHCRCPEAGGRNDVGSQAGPRRQHAPFIKHNNNYYCTKNNNIIKPRIWDQTLLNLILMRND